MGTLGAVGPAGFVEAAAQPDEFDVTVVAGTDSLALSWDAVEGALWYCVYCGLGNDVLAPVSAPLLGTSFEVEGLMAGRAYWVQVLAELGPKRSIASTVLAVATASCVPLQQSACYQAIQAGTEVLGDRAIDSDGGGFGNPYHYTASLDWADGSCGVQFELQRSFGSMFVVIDHANIPLQRQDMRRVVLNVPQDLQALLVVQSNPAALSGDPVFSQQLPRDDPYSLVIDFTTDCAGRLVTAVATLYDTGE